MSARADAADVRTARDRLAGEARALQARDRDEVVAAVARLMEAFRDPASEIRKKLEADLPAATGFSKEVVSEGLCLALAGWTEDALQKLVDDELAGCTPAASGFETTAVLLAGSIPMPTLTALVFPLLLGSTVLAKPSRGDRVTARIVAEGLTQIDAALGRCIEVSDFNSSDAEATAAFLGCPCVVAYGSDETIAVVAAQTSAEQRVVSHGHRLSIALLGEAASAGDPLPRVARELARDVALWDQLGCLSAAAIYVLDPGGDNTTAVAQAMAEALEETQRQLPRGELSAGTRASIAHQRSEAELRAASDAKITVHSGNDLAYTVVAEASAQWRSSPLHRFVRIYPVSSLAAIGPALQPIASHLSSVALDGFGPNEARVGQGLLTLGASRVCQPGQLQAPSLDWHHDGMPPLRPMARREH